MAAKKKNREEEDGEENSINELPSARRLQTESQRSAAATQRTDALREDERGRERERGG